MIDPLEENLLSISEAAEIFPPRRRGKKPSISCVYRWMKRGCRGIVLESIQCGGTKATSEQAVARFLTRLTKNTLEQTDPSASRASEAAKQLEVEWRPHRAEKHV